MSWSYRLRLVPWRRLLFSCLLKWLYFPPLTIKTSFPLFSSFSCLFKHIYPQTFYFRISPPRKLQPRNLIHLIHRSSSCNFSFIKLVKFFVDIICVSSFLVTFLYLKPSYSFASKILVPSFYNSSFFISERLKTCLKCRSILIGQHHWKIHLTISCSLLL